MSASGKFAKLPHFLQFVPTHFRTPSERVEELVGICVCGGQRWRATVSVPLRLAVDLHHRHQILESGSLHDSR
jgi:hypothetical protein